MESMRIPITKQANNVFPVQYKQQSTELRCHIPFNIKLGNFRDILPSHALSKV